MEMWIIKNHVVEYIDELHQYLVDGIMLPSITQILKIKFGNKYVGVDKETLDNAAKKGTRVHEAIEKYEKYNVSDIGCTELRNYKFLKKQYKFECLDNEVPIILFKDNVPIACGRLDLVLEQDGQLGLGDIKRTSTLDKEYLAYQLNLYKIGYRQSYDKEAKVLKGLHLRNDVRKYVDIPIKEDMAWELVEEYMNKEVMTSE